MRRPLLLALALLTTCVPAARAQSVSYGLNLCWNRCYSGGGTASASFACDSSTGPPLSLIASVVIPADMPRFAAASVVVDIWVSGSALPPWWQTNTGQCRAGAITPSFDSPTLEATGCPSIWMNALTQSVFMAQQGVNAPYMMRLSAGAAVPEADELSLVADGAELAVARLSISRAKSTGADACVGCPTPVCMQYQECHLQQHTGFDDFRVTNGASFYGQFAFLNSSAPEVSIENAWWPCSLVATRNRTWGAIKTLYR